MDNPGTLEHLAQDAGRRQTQKTQHRKLKRSTQTPPKTGGRTQVLPKGKQFLPHIKYPPFYLYVQDVLDTTMRKQTHMIFQVYFNLRYLSITRYLLYICMKINSNFVLYIYMNCVISRNLKKYEI